MGVGAGGGNLFRGLGDEGDGEIVQEDDGVAGFRGAEGEGVQVEGGGEVVVFEGGVVGC